uniref:Uncharacterized protein n=1 Tax=Strongyloides papillosus TaxID=174720 RepID=A0A0N5BFW7_STREA
MLLSYALNFVTTFDEIMCNMYLYGNEVSEWGIKEVQYILSILNGVLKFLICQLKEIFHMVIEVPEANSRDFD